MCLLKLIALNQHQKKLLVIRQDEENKEKEQDSQIDTKHQTPSQMASEKIISELEKKLNVLYAAKNSMPSIQIQKQINKLSDDLKKEKQSLKWKRQNAEYQRKHRTTKRTKFEEICHDNPDIKRELALRDSVGRPSLNVDQPWLLKAIADIAIIESAADAKRRSQSIRSVKTLDDLTAELKKVGFTISRSGTYLRLIPRNSSTIEGRRHVTTVPVELSRAQADFRRSHIDTQFAATTTRYLETLASILGPT
ncbi:hypothetical protein AVEN_98510-1 [Araneus ventricosus]|uniref:Uncharacterized protein n=1 Tax=Araneus ventricosus TaxID=182803 RepID=A0A4Y2EU41_ARAVE|nr:hypothetical protein AVEN_98510-1 [Araneus ventricosus]